MLRFVYRRFPRFARRWMDRWRHVGAPKQGRLPERYAPHTPKHVAPASPLPVGTGKFAHELQGANVISEELCPQEALQIRVIRAGRRVR
jgi:hypothetical protein